MAKDLGEQFNEFNEENPHVYKEIVALAREARNRGRNKIMKCRAVTSKSVEEVWDEELIEIAKENITRENKKRNNPRQENHPGQES